MFMKNSQKVIQKFNESVVHIHIPFSKLGFVNFCVKIFVTLFKCIELCPSSWRTPTGRCRSAGSSGRGRPRRGRSRRGRPTSATTTSSPRPRCSDRPSSEGTRPTATPMSRSSWPLRDAIQDKLLDFCFLVSAQNAIRHTPNIFNEPVPRRR